MNAHSSKQGIKSFRRVCSMLAIAPDTKDNSAKNQFSLKGFQSAIEQPFFRLLRQARRNLKYSLLYAVRKNLPCPGGRWMNPWLYFRRSEGPWKTSLRWLHQVAVKEDRSRRSNASRKKRTLLLCVIKCRADCSCHATDRHFNWC